MPSLWVYTVKKKGRLYINKNENWKEIQIENYGKLMVSKNGEVFSLKANKILSQRKKQDGYLYVRIRLKDHSEKCLFIHRLIAQAFIPNPEMKKEVNHKDFDRTNNCADNLEWCTRLENIRYSQEHGRYKKAYNNTGSKNPKAKLTEKQVIDIRKLYDSGMCIADIAKEYKRGWSTINNIVKGLTWTHIK